MSGIRVRFAPSPTGTLHVGGARTALFNWLYARAQGGSFVLRVEDTDQERSTDASHQQILRAMEWLGLDCDEGPTVGGDFGPYVQSERRSIYDEYAQRLLDQDLGYRCYCTSDELDAQRAAAKAEADGSSVGYDGRCSKLGTDEREAFEAAGRSHVLRVKMPDDGVIRWTDLVHGDLEFQCAVLDDWVAIKGDGFPTYNFAAVVDDGLMEISHVLRGDDHVSNTPRQIHLFKAFGFRVPKFGHMPMILGADGKRLSKRHGAASVEEFRDAHYLSDALVNYLGLLGWSPGNNQEFFTVQQLVKKFSLKRLNNSAAVFDPDKFQFLNAEHMKTRSDQEKAELAWPILVAAGAVEDGDATARERLPAIIKLMGNRFGHLGDAVGHLSAYFCDDYPVAAEAGDLLSGEAAGWMLALASSLESAAAFTAEEIESTLRHQAEALGLKAAQLIHPARVATTGQTVGPGVFDVLAAVGRDRVLARLRAPRTA